jgi:glutamyl-tRNA synthetase
MKVKVRFAPSPTGVLHIGGARTALFNFLYAKHTNGKFFVRVEDTDKERSTEESVNAIIDGLEWLKILPAEEQIIYQSRNISRHQDIAKQLIEMGAAYYCYTSAEELKQLREDSENQSKGSFKFQSKWRDEANRPKDIPVGVDPVIRLRVSQEGETIVDDLIQGQVTTKNSQLDDMVLLRSDGSPTYLLACVVDDYDMGITHVIRGDDHLNNAFRQLQIYKALRWDPPHFAHIPLIHGKDGAKLSKRHGALGLEHYKDKGYLPEAVINYLLRLGWGHGNDEIISMEQAIEWFDIKDVKKSPARLDFDKLLHLNAHYIKAMDNGKLVLLLQKKFKELANLSKDKLKILEQGIEGTKLRAKTLDELLERSRFYILDEPIEISEEAKEFINSFNKRLLEKLIAALQSVQTWNESTLKSIVEKFMQENELKMKEVAHVLRSLLAGTVVSPGVFEMMKVLGKEKTLARIQRV